MVHLNQRKKLFWSYKRLLALWIILRKGEKERILECGKTGERTDGGVQSDKKMQIPGLNNCNLFLKMKMWWDNRGESVGKKERAKLNMEGGDEIESFSFLLPAIWVAGPCFRCPLVILAPSFPELLSVNCQSCHFYWLRSFYSHKLGEQFWPLNVTGCFPHPSLFANFPQHLPMFFLLWVVFSFPASSLWSSTWESVSSICNSLLWNTENTIFALFFIF